MHVTVQDDVRVFPAPVHPSHIEIVSERYRTSNITQAFGYQDDRPLPSGPRRAEIDRLIRAPAAGA